MRTPEEITNHLFGPAMELDQEQIIQERINIVARAMNSWSALKEGPVVDPVTGQHVIRTFKEGVFLYEVEGQSFTSYEVEIFQREQG